MRFFSPASCGLLSSSTPGREIFPDCRHHLLFRLPAGLSRQPTVSTHSEAFRYSGTGAEHTAHLPTNDSDQTPEGGFSSLKKVSRPVLVVLVSSVPRSGSTYLGQFDFRGLLSKTRSFYPIFIFVLVYTLHVWLVLV